MRRLLVPLVVVLAASWGVAQEAATPKPAGVEGIWEGPLNVGVAELRLAFHVTKGKDGALAVKMDSIDQGAFGIPCPEVAFADRKLTLGFPPIKASFAGTLAATNDTITGTWEQSGQKFPLTLKRVEKPSTLNRPQHPKPPFPYKTTDVTFENPVGKFTLAGTLTTPTGEGPFPAVVLVSGSGPQDRDETLLGHKPFLVLADHLTRNGIAVLRYDDRGVGKSKGKHDGATSADFATDAHAAVTFLKSRQRIDPKRIGLMGHSEGGLIAPMVAADHPADVAFLVLLAGTGIPGGEVIVGQQAAVAKAQGGNPEAIAALRGLMDALLPVAKGDAPPAERKAAMEKRFDEYVAGLTDDDRNRLATAGDAKVLKSALVARLAEPWHHHFLRHDPRPTLAKVKCPVLAVNGALDLQVLPDANMAGIAKALKDGGNTRLTTKVFPGLNHLFQHTKTGKITEYGQIEETFAPEALAFVTEWVTALK